MVVTPIVEWLEHDPAIDPSGSRHLKSGPAGFLRVLSTNVGGQLDFGNVDISLSGQVSDTKLCFARVSNFNGASGITNLRFFLHSIAAFGAGTYRFLEDKNLHFIPDHALIQANDDTPTAIPSVPNIKGTIAALFANGQTAISGVGDQDVTQYVHLGVFVDTDVPVRTYGGAGAGNFRYRLLFEFS